MKHQLPEILEAGRIMSGPLASKPSMQWNGAFEILGPNGRQLFMIISNGMGWEHVSVQEEPMPDQQQAVPSWETMCWVKNLIWGENETVVQYHPRKLDYVNNHPYVLHLWRPTKEKLPKPNPRLVGVR